MFRFRAKLTNGQCVFQTFYLFFLFIVSVASATQPCADGLSVDLTAGQVFADGRIVYDGITYDKQYVYSKNVSGDIKTFGCLCQFKNCYRKCCRMGYVMNDKKCTKDKMRDIVLNKGLDLYYINALKINVGVNDPGTGFLYGRPDEDVYKEDEKWFLQQDGNLYISIPGSVPPFTIKTPDKYCIDTFVGIDDNGNPEYKLDALVCYAGESMSEWDRINYIITATCMLISCVFILMTVAVYLWLPELRNLHGRVLMAYLLCLFVSFIFFATLQILILLNSNSTEICLVFTFIIYYFLEAAFFWLNVMSFDIWWTFSGKRGTNLEKLSTQARFCAYALYAFGVPTVLTTIMASLEFSGLPAHYLMPNIRSHGCFLHGNSRLIYLYGPIVVVVGSNIIFYLLTALKIAQIKKQTSVLKSKDSTTHDQRNTDQQRLVLYVKLFVVMGINWLLEIISAVYPIANGFWIITDAYNVLAGLIIFIIFVCKRKIFRLMKKRYLQMTGKEPLSRNVTTSSRTVSSRDDIRMSVKSSANIINGAVGVVQLNK